MGAGRRGGYAGRRLNERGGDGRGAMLRRMYVFAALWSLVIALFDLGVGSSIVTHARTAGHPRTEGVIVASRVTNDRPDSDGTVTHGVAIEYTYEVAGRSYRGTRYRGAPSSQSGSWAAEVVERFPVGARVPVFYPPADPADAVLSAGLDGGDGLLPRSSSCRSMRSRSRLLGQLPLSRGAPRRPRRRHRRPPRRRGGGRRARACPETYLAGRVRDGAAGRGLRRAFVLHLRRRFSVRLRSARPRTSRSRGPPSWSWRPISMRARPARAGARAPGIS